VDHESRTALDHIMDYMWTMDHMSVDHRLECIVEWSQWTMDSTPPIKVDLCGLKLIRVDPIRGQKWTVERSGLQLTVKWN